MWLLLHVTGGLAASAGRSTPQRTHSSPQIAITLSLVVPLKAHAGSATCHFLLSPRACVPEWRGLHGAASATYLFVKIAHTASYFVR